MEGAKTAFQSLTINASTAGAIASVIVLGAKMAGVELNTEEIITTIMAITTLVTSLMSIYGRIKAKYVIK